MIALILAAALGTPYPAFPAFPACGPDGVLCIQQGTPWPPIGLPPVQNACITNEGLTCDPYGGALDLRGTTIWISPSECLRDGQEVQCPASPAPRPSHWEGGGAVSKGECVQGGDLLVCNTPAGVVYFYRGRP